MSCPLTDKARFARRLRAWFSRHGRDLPWRRTHDPYAVLVSEIMLQQTTVAAVVPYFERWMRKFPTVRSLALAEESAVLALWQGLGYYRRARYLHAAAQRVLSLGKFPCDNAGLRKLPGVGDYTAQAVRAFAFDEPAPVLDANITRVVARLFDVRLPVDAAAGRGEARRRLEELLPAKGGRLFISALMDLGAMICRAGVPDCSQCPVREFCAAQNPAMLPVKSPKPPVKARVEHAAWVSDGRGVLLQQSLSRRWGGLWRLPPLGEIGEAAVEICYSIVRERVTLKVYPVSVVEAAECAEPRRMFSFRGLGQTAIPSPHRRAIARMLQKGVEGA